MVKFNYVPPTNFPWDIIEILWNKGLIMIGLMYGITINPWFYLLIVPSILVDLRIENEPVEVQTTTK